MGRSGWRWKDLHVVFRAGSSSLLNSVGALCIIFEDYHVEADALIAMRNAPASERAEFEQFYYVRRSLVTLHAYRDCLNELCSNPEFIAKRPFIPREHLDRINSAHSYLNKNDVLRWFRNDLGAHINSSLIRASIEHYGENAISCIGWESSDEAFDLKLPFATDLLRGAFASKLPGGLSNLKAEMGAFFDVMVQALERISHATHALVLVFLWDRFG